MFRPLQHETDDKGEALLRMVCAQLSWTINRIDKDYGRDFDIEVFRNGKTTGLTFNVQLKSTACPSYSKNGDFVSVGLKMASARYLVEELDVPAFLIQADLNQNRLYWSSPQIDAALRSGIARDSPARSCTIRIPVKNELPDAAKELIETLGRLRTVLASRRLMEIETAPFVAATRSVIESADLSKSLRDKSDALDLMVAQSGTEEGDFNAARVRIQEVLSSPRSSVESKFFALLLEEKNERLSARTTQDDRADHLRVILTTASKLLELTRKGPGALKLYALLAHVAAEFYQLVREDWGLYQNWRVHETTEDVWWRAELRTRRSEVSQLILRKFEQFLRLVRLSERTPYQSALPLALLRIVEGALTLILRLESEEMPGAAASIRNSVFQVCKLASAIATQFGQDSERARSAVSAAMLSSNRGSECVLWAEREIEELSDNQLREWARSMLVSQGKSTTDDQRSAEIVPIQTEQQVYVNMASALGIDLTDLENPIAAMVRTGIADFDPTRILRECSYMFLTLSRRGPGLLHFMLARQLHLPTMGAKIIHCTLHKYIREGVSLDETYQRFREDYCAQCPDHLWRDSDWRYTHEWQLQENELNKDFMAGPRLPTHKHISPAPAIPRPGSACAACDLEFADSGAPWWCGFCQTWFCQRKECADAHMKHPLPY